MAASRAGSPNRRRLADLVADRGQRLAFGTRRGGDVRRLDIMTVPVAGGTPEPVTHDEHHRLESGVGARRASVYFVSDRGGSTNIWRVPIDEASRQSVDEPEPITSPSRSRRI